MHEFFWENGLKSFYSILDLKLGLLVQKGKVHGWGDSSGNSTCFIYGRGPELETQHSSNKLARSCKPTVHKTGGQNKQTPGSSLTSQTRLIGEVPGQLETVIKQQVESTQRMTPKVTSDLHMHMHTHAAPACTSIHTQICTQKQTKKSKVQNKQTDLL